MCDQWVWVDGKLIKEERPASDQEKLGLTQILKDLDDPRAYSMIYIIERESLMSLHANLLMWGIKVGSKGTERKKDKFLDEIEKFTEEIRERRSEQ